MKKIQQIWSDLDDETKSRIEGLGFGFVLIGLIVFLLIISTEMRP